MIDSFKGKRLLYLGDIPTNRLPMHIFLIEAELKEMGFEIIDTVNLSGTKGWFLDIWNAQCIRLNIVAFNYVLFGEPNIISEYLEFIPDIPKLHKLEEIEIPGTLKQVKTALTSKKFGI